MMFFSFSGSRWMP